MSIQDIGVDVGAVSTARKKTRRKRKGESVGQINASRISTAVKAPPTRNPSAIIVSAN